MYQNSEDHCVFDLDIMLLWCVCVCTCAPHIIETSNDLPKSEATRKVLHVYEDNFWSRELIAENVYLKSM